MQAPRERLHCLCTGLGAAGILLHLQGAQNTSTGCEKTAPLTPDHHPSKSLARRPQEGLFGLREWGRASRAAAKLQAQQAQQALLEQQAQQAQQPLPWDPPKDWAQHCFTSGVPDDDGTAACLVRMSCGTLNLGLDRAELPAPDPRCVQRAQRQRHGCLRGDQDGTTELAGAELSAAEAADSGAAAAACLCTSPQELPALHRRAPFAQLPCSGTSSGGVPPLLADWHSRCSTWGTCTMHFRASTPDAQS